MKKILILSIITFFQTDKKKNNLPKENLKGKVKSVRAIGYEAIEKFGKAEKGKVEALDDSNYYQLYNEQGHLIEENKYNINGNLSKKIIYKYNDKGNEIEKNIFITRTLYIKFTYKYDNKGNLIEMNSYNSKGNFNGKWIYKYDDKGNEIEVSAYNSDESFDEKWTFKNDDKGNKVEENRYETDGRLNYKTTFKYEYDKYDNWIRCVSYLDDKLQYIAEREIEYYK